MGNIGVLVDNRIIPCVSQTYGKNLRIQIGKGPVRSIFPEALKVLRRGRTFASFIFDIPRRCLILLKAMGSSIRSDLRVR